MNINRVLILAVATASITVARAQSVPDVQKIPDHVAYRHLFAQFSSLRRAADKRESDGRSGEPVRHLLHRKANLSASEMERLDNIVAQQEIEVAKIDARARELIRAYRAQYPGGIVPHGEKPRAVPAELKELQRQRNQSCLQARDQIHKAFGDARFQQFDAFVKRKALQDATVALAGSEE